jgi:hypothetical protein
MSEILKVCPSRLANELLVAISWVEPPFVDDQTSLEEIRARIALLLADRDRACEYARKRGEMQ